MNNVRREEHRGRSRRRRGGSRGGAATASSEQRSGPIPRGQDGEQYSANARQEKDQSISGAESVHQRERRNGRGPSGRGPRGRGNERNSVPSPDSIALRGSGSGGNQETSMKKKQPKAVEDALLKERAEEAERLEAERLEAERQEAERKETERKEAELKEEERREAERKEQEKNAAIAAELSARRREQRIINLAYCGESPSTPRISETELRKLDSSLKKCTGFIRKLRGGGITEDSHKSLLADVRSLNLSRYISEVVAAISESKLRSADTEYASILCSELHQRFDDFAAQLSSVLSTIVLSTHATAGKDLSGRKGAMRLLVELFVVGMYPDVAAVISVLRELMKSVRDSREAAVGNLSVVASFVRAVSRFLLLRPNVGTAKNSPVASWEDEIASLQTKQTITTALESYYKGEVSKLYDDARQELRKAEYATLRARQTKGSVDDATAAKHDEALQICERVFSACGTIAEALGQDPPSPISKLADEIELSKAKAREGNIGISVVGAGSSARYRDLDFESGQDAEQLFASEEERAFYNDFANIGPRGSDGGAALPNGKDENSAIDNVKAKGPAQDNAKAKVDHIPANETKTVVGASQDSTKLNAESSSKSELEKVTGSGRSSSRRKGDKNPSLDNLLARLGATETRENADRFTNQFIIVAENSRNPTKRLSKSLIQVSAQKLNVLPAYARIAASLRQAYPEVAQNVAGSLEEDFRFLAGRTDVDEKTLASCIKTARYLGEYVKFRMVDFGTIFSLLAICMKDFSGHRVDIACHLLETCGRMIYLTPASSLRMGNLLDTVWRLKSVKNLEARHNTLVETAFFAAKPSSGIKLQRRKVRPPMHEYIRRLIYSWLTAENVRWTAMQMKRLPWDDELQLYVIKKFVNVSRVKFSTIPQVAQLISAVGKFRKEVLVGVVDGILEAVRSGMERNDGRDSQRRVSEVALLGELYNAHVIGEAHVFFVLYQFIALGHEAPADAPSDRTSSTISLNVDGNVLPEALSPGASLDNTPGDSNVDIQARRTAGNSSYQTAPDPPKDFFRIRLTCTLLETCGATLLHEKRRKLEVFWAFFERYVFCKAGQAGFGEQLPLHVDHIVDDAFERMTRLESMQNAFHEKQSGRRVLTENSSRIRIRSRESDKREKRASMSKPVPNANVEQQWKRCKTLEDALKQVSEIEQTPLDFALVTLPIRSVIQAPVHESISPNAASSPKAVSPQLDGLNKSSPALDSNSQLGDVSSPSPQAASAKNKNEGIESHSGNVVTPGGNADISESSVEEDLDDENVSGSEADMSDDYDDEEEEEERASTTNDFEVDGGSEDEPLDSDDDLDVDDEDDEDEDDDDEDEEDELILEKSQGPKTGEEEAFERELAAITAAAVQTARESPSRVPTLNRMAIPMGLMAQKIAADRAAAAAAAVNGMKSDGSTKSPGSRWDRKKRTKEVRVDFKFLVRKGGKSQIQDLAVPATSSLAVAAKESENAEAAVQAEKKRLVLESSIVVNGDDEDSLDRVVPLRTQQDARAKEQSIKEQRSADEMALLSTLFKPKPRR